MAQDLKVVLRIDGETGKVRFEVDKLEKKLKEAGISGKNSGEKISHGMDKATKSTKNTNRQVNEFKQSLLRLASVGFAIKLSKDFVQVADTMKLLDARIKLVTDSQREYNHAQQETIRIALETHTSLEDTVNLYTRLERSLKTQGSTQEDVLQITQTINEAFAVSGATAIEASNAIRQLTQSFSANRLSGDEFRSVSEQGSRIMQVLQEELGKTAGELKKMAEAGELTTKVLTDALLAQSEKIAVEFAGLPVTVDKALKDLGTMFGQYAKGVNDSTDITQNLSDAIVYLSNNLDEIFDTMSRVVIAFALFKGAKGVAGLIPLLKTQTVVMKTATIGSLLYGEALATTTIKTTALSRATKGLTAFLKANPIGIAITAGFLAFEYFDNVIDEHNDKLDSLTFKYEEVESAMINVFGLLAQDNKPQAIIAIENAIDSQLKKLKILETELTKIGEDNFFRQRDGSAVLSRDDIELRNAAIDSIEKEKAAIEELRKIQELAKQSGSEFAQSVKNIGDAYQTAGRFINIFGDILPNVISSQELLNISTSKNSDIVGKWLVQADKQLTKMTAKNQAWNKTATQIILTEAAAKKKLTTDKKLIAEIDKTTKALIKQVKINEDNVENKKTEIALNKERKQLIEDTLSLMENYGTEAEKLLLIEIARTDELAKFPKHQDAVNNKYDELRGKIEGVSKELEKQNKLWNQYEQLLSDLGLIDETEASFLALEIAIEDMAIAMNLSSKEIQILRDGLNKLKLDAEDDIEINININKSSISELDGVFESVINNIGGNIEDTIRGLSQEFFRLGQDTDNSSYQNIGIGLAGIDGYLTAVNQGVDDVGSVLRGVQSALALIPGWGQAITAVSEVVDQLTGGRLFGTSYERESSSFNINLAGGSGTTTTESRERALWGGTQTRELFEALTGDALQAINDIAAQRDIVATQTAIALGTTAAELINATFTQLYDAEGNVTLSRSIIAGVGSFSDPDVDAFATRVIAEQIIAGLDVILPEVEIQVLNAMNDFTRRFGDLEGFDFEDSFTTQLVGEATNLANQFRNQGAEALLEFAEFALLAVADIQNGAGLLETLTGNLSLIQDLQQPTESLSDAYTRVSQATLIYQEAIDFLGISTDLTREEFIRFSSTLSDLAGGVQEFAGLWQTYFSEFYTPEELRLNSISSQSDLLGQQASNLGIDPNITETQFRELFETQLALGNLSEEQTVQWLEFAGALSRVNDLIDTQNELENERIELLEQERIALVAANAEYDEYSSNLARQLDDINGVNNGLNDIRSTYSNNVSTLNTLAIATGRAGASTQDLANAHLLYVAQIRQATQALFEQLYGDDLDSRIAELEATQTTGFNNVATASNNLFSGWHRAIDNLHDYTQSRLVGDFSPLEADQRLEQAQADFYAAVQAAQGGDLQAAQSLPGLARIIDELNVAVNASGSDYNAIFYDIQAALESISIPNGLGGGVGDSSTGSGISPELQALYDERDARLNEQENNHRLELATQLSEHLNALAEAVNQPLFDIADEIGLNMRDLVTDLGVNLDALTVASVENLANISNLLGVSLLELATNLGDDVSIAMGVLADEQSLLNDALENTIAGLPEGIESSLTGLLNDVENAADGTAQEAALLALENATAGLPIEYRNQLAPFFDSIDPTSELQEQISQGYIQIGHLNRIADNLQAQNNAAGINSFAIGTSYVDRDQVANIHKGEIIVDSKSANILRKYGIQTSGTNNEILIKQVQTMSNNIKRLENQLSRLNRTNDEISDNTRVISDNTDDIKNKPTETETKRTVCGGVF